MHINPPQFLVNWIEDAKRADKLFYSFRFRPSFPEIFQSKDSQLKEKAASHYYYEGAWESGTIRFHTTRKTWTFRPKSCQKRYMFIGKVTMSSSNSDSNEYESLSSASECIFEEERDIEAGNRSDHSDDDHDDLVEAYSDEPLADEGWLAEYSKRQNDTKRQLEELTRRMDGTESTNSW